MILHVQREAQLCVKPQLLWDARALWAICTSPQPQSCLQASMQWWYGCRPCGSSTLLASYDKEGPQLYLIEPTGIALVSTGALPHDNCVLDFVKGYDFRV